MGHPMRVTAADVHALRADGFAVLRGALDRDDVGRLAAVLDSHRLAPVGAPVGGPAADADRTGLGHDGYGDVNSPDSRDFFLRVPEVAAWHDEVGLAGAAAALLGTAGARAVRDRLFVKTPDGGERTMWHQDQPLTQEATGDLVVLWVPLAIEDGAAPLVIARGSHGGPKMIESGIAWWRHVDGTDSAVVEAADIEERFDVVTATASVGDVVALHGLVLHASEPNHSPAERAALSTRFIPV
jgi:ectoine hydroxylase-related dioxygenase (phytanoyl-CoA dioxygenase family)